MGQFADAARKVKRLRKNLEDGHERATKDGMDTVQDELARALKFNGSVARPLLIGDITQHARATTEAAEEVVSMPEWAKYLNDGTGPRGDGPYPAPDNAPYGAILTWAKAKPITPREYPTVEDAAAAIARSISEKGTHPHPFIEPVWNSTYGTDQIIAKNRQAMSEALRRSF